MRDKNYLVPRVGVEPTTLCGDRVLSPARIPVPPPRQIHFRKSKFFGKDFKGFSKRNFGTLL